MTPGPPCSTSCAGTSGCAALASAAWASGAYVGAVAETEVNRATGRVRLTRVFLTHDCGQAVNPDGLRNQLEGNVVQTASRTLEELTFDRGRVTSLNWAAYPISTFPEAPKVETELIDRPGERPCTPASRQSPTRCSTRRGVRLRAATLMPERVRQATGQS